MEDIRLHLDGRDAAEWPVGEGVHRLVREANGSLGFGEAARGALLAQVCRDRRGLWLQVANGVRGIHVNGRSVRRVAMLRPGDNLYLDGVDVTVLASAGPGGAVPAAGPGRDGDVRVLLRGVGGAYHGRSLPLDQPRVVGSGADADIRVDAPGVAERHARLERHGDHVLLRDLDSVEGTLVNGQRLRDAVLAPGDQLSFGPQHRFVVEAPFDRARALPRTEASDEDEVVDAPRPSAARWPWLLLAALFLAGLLAGLLLFGAG